MTQTLVERAPRQYALREAAVSAALVTATVVAVSWVVPSAWVAAAVGLVFLLGAFFLVWRADDAEVARFGIAFGGVVLRGPLDIHAAMAGAAKALAWALVAAAVTFGPYALGFRIMYGGRAPFVSAAAFPGAWSLLNSFFAQVVVVALPEEVFYRGYLQTRLDDVWSPRVQLAGARLGWGLLVSSGIFALGHVATVPRAARLAVFFPSLLFGWLRARTGGVGAPLVFHALCNVLSEALARGYGAY